MNTKLLSTHVFFHANGKNHLVETTGKHVVYYPLEDLALMSGISKKRINLWIHRHKEIKTLKRGKEKLVDDSILPYLFSAVGELNKQTV